MGVYDKLTLPRPGNEHIYFLFAISLLFNFGTPPPVFPKWPICPAQPENFMTVLIQLLRKNAKSACPRLDPPGGSQKVWVPGHRRDPPPRGLKKKPGTHTLPVNGPGHVRKWGGEGRGPTLVGQVFNFWPGANHYI